MITDVKEDIVETISITVKQSILLKHKLSIIDFFIMKEVDKIAKNSNTSAKLISTLYPAIFASKRTARNILENLVDRNFLEKKEDLTIFNQITFSYILTKDGYAIVHEIHYKPKYSKEGYFHAIQVIDHWNSIKCLSTHTVKPYGEIQTKTIDEIISYISDLLKGEASWGKGSHIFSISEIVSIIDKFTLKFEDKYKPDDKKLLPKSLSSFFCSYKSKYSEFFSVFEHGVSQIRTTLDDLKDIGISTAVLRKSYSVLSSTGQATNVEKLEIQKNIWRTYRRYSTHIEVLLDDLYGWRKIYREKVKNFNVFIFEFLKYIEAEVGKGNAKTGFLSFNRGNKILEAFSKYFADKYNIYLFPTEKQIKNIKKSRIVVDKG